MSVELLYTSAPQGLRPGSRGFCSVLSTKGLPSNVELRLEALSAYRHLFPPSHPDAIKNPVNFSCLRIAVGGQLKLILSRISDYGVDYSQRTNMLAHHIVIEENEQSPAGPAWLMLQRSFFRTSWDGVCTTPLSGPTIPRGDQAPQICEQWLRHTNDAGWAGVVASSFIAAASKPLWIIYDISQAQYLLELLNESICLLPPSQRWQASFSTYATNLPPDATCRVCCIPAGTDDALRAATRAETIDLTKPLPLAPTSELVALARGAISPPAMPHVQEGRPPQFASSRTFTVSEIKRSRDELDDSRSSELQKLKGLPASQSVAPDSDQLTLAPVRTSYPTLAMAFDDPTPIRSSRNKWFVGLTLAAIAFVLATCIAFYSQQTSTNTLAEETKTASDHRLTTESPQHETDLNGNSLRDLPEESGLPLQNVDATSSAQMPVPATLNITDATQQSDSSQNLSMRIAELQPTIGTAVPRGDEENIGHEHADLAQESTDSPTTLDTNSQTKTLSARILIDKLRQGHCYAELLYPLNDQEWNSSVFVSEKTKARYLKPDLRFDLTHSHNPAVKEIEVSPDRKLRIAVDIAKLSDEHREMCKSVIGAYTSYIKTVRDVKDSGFLKSMDLTESDVQDDLVRQFDSLRLFENKLSEPLQKEAGAHKNTGAETNKEGEMQVQSSNTGGLAPNPSDANGGMRSSSQEDKRRATNEQRIKRLEQESEQVGRIRTSLESLRTALKNFRAAAFSTQVSSHPILYFQYSRGNQPTDLRPLTISFTIDNFGEKHDSTKAP